ncbi:MAG: hypothetical protein IJ812_09095, partial [Schwartzia sp.]|nr:hypothetical protein [Schwartzia sp. (in: firmicutes)]
MAMETNTAMPTSIRPIERPQGPQTSGVQRRGGVTTSPFAPRTDVSLQNSVSDVANLLSKIASTKEEATNELSPQLQKLIDSIMKQSFSLESTLAEGLGTTLENQRFAIDQMFTLSRMLHQMGTLSEQGRPAALNDEMQTLLSNFRELVATEEGGDMTPIMLHKLAFEVLDGKTAEELPDMLRFMLSPQGMQSAVVPPQGESDAFAFMKKLMDFFMPRPGADGSAPAPEQGAPQTMQNTQTGATPQNGQPAQNAQAGTAPQNGQPTQNTQTGTMPQNGQPTQNAQTGTMPQNGQPAQNAQTGTMPQTGQPAQNAQTGTMPQNGQPTQNAQTGTMPQNGQPTQNAQTGTMPQNGQPAQNAQTGTMPQTGQPAQNTQA